MLVHLLGELARELDGLHVGPEGATEDALEEALDLALDGAQDAHCAEGRLPAKGSGRSAARAPRECRTEQPVPSTIGSGGSAGASDER